MDYNLLHCPPLVALRQHVFQSEISYDSVELSKVFDIIRVSAMLLCRKMLVYICDAHSAVFTKQLPGLLQSCSSRFALMKNCCRFS